MADQSWIDLLKHYTSSLVEFAAKNPKEFLATFFIILTPLMLICGYLSYLMIKQIEEKEKAKRKKAIRSNNVARTRRKATKAD